MQPEKILQQENALRPEKWVDQYADPLFAFALARIRDHQFAEDIVQSTFLSAWKARATYTGEAAEKTWLFSICKNKIIDYYRNSNRKLQLEEKAGSGNRKLRAEEDFYFDKTGHWTEAAAPKEWGLATEHPSTQREFFEVLALCSSRLKLIQQQVFSLKYLEEMSSEEICAALEITDSNYWVLMHRAKLHLRACLEKNWLQLK